MYLEALVDVGIVGLCSLVSSLVMLLFAAKMLRFWQNLGPGSSHDKFACRDLAFCWLSLISVLAIGVISDMLLEENGAIGWTMVVAYLLVAMHLGTDGSARPQIDVDPDPEMLAATANLL